MKKLIGFILIVWMSSCMKDEIPVGIPAPGEIETGSVDMESDYKYQVYFNLQLGEDVAQNHKQDWDLGFECSTDGWHVILNSSKLMYAINTEDTNFAALKDTLGFSNWKFDGVTGHLDSTAVGNWQLNPQYVYIINRGVNLKGKPIGLYKIRILEVTSDSYSIEFAPLSEDIGKKMVINKVNDVNFISLSFLNEGEAKVLEPFKNNWDLLFTQYTEYLFDGTNYIPYLVAGAQINRHETFATFDKDISWDDMTLEKASTYILSDRIDQPGYKWKTFNLEAGTYLVDPDYIYIIKTQQGLYYKLRFIDFYNDQGEKGRPVFEYQQL